MTCYVFNQKIYTNKKKLIDEIDNNDSQVYKFNNYFEASFCVGQYDKSQFKNKLMSIKFLKESIIPKTKINNVIKKVNENIFKSNLDMIKVFTDGSSFCNGAKNKNLRKGGIGVFFGDNDERNVSEPFKIGEITNQRTELYACIKTLQILDNCDQQIQINTDSEYTINCITKWYKGWERNNWKNAKKQPVKNQDLIKQLYNFYKKNKVTFNHVRGHKGIYGNEMADHLAVEGSKMSK